MTKENHLQLNTWAEDVKTAVNDFVDMYGNTSKLYSKDSYVVFDFDNTTCIFDVQDQCLIYQLETMSFPLDPDSFKDILLKNISSQFENLITDSMNAYSCLYKEYGPFSVNGLSDDMQKEIANNPYWMEFASKMGILAMTIPKYHDNWKLRWLAGFTEDQVNNMCYESCKKYSDVDTFELVITGSSDIKSITGPKTFKFVCGLRVTDNIKELWKVLSQNGIHVWVCSSSELNQIKAAIDFFGLAEYCTGLVAKTMCRDQNGCLTWEYDFENGYGYLKKGGQWIKDQYPVKASCRDTGKVKAINNAIAVHYNGSGPIAGFMDSSGDFNFCTEYKNTKLVICFNRADRSIKDGGGLISTLAIYQRDTLGYNLSLANKNDDTLYVLQGRDENGQRHFVASNQSIVFGEHESKLFVNDDCTKQLQYFIQNKKTCTEIINDFCIKSEGDKNLFNAEYGFLDNYDGYHHIA